MESYNLRYLFWMAVLLLGVASCTLQETGGASKNPEEETINHSQPRPKAEPKPDLPDEPCHYNGHPLHVGPKGGCYYFYDGRKKEYVDHSFCKDCPSQEKKGK